MQSPEVQVNRLSASSDHEIAERNTSSETHIASPVSERDEASSAEQEEEILYDYTDESEPAVADQNLRGDELVESASSSSTSSYDDANERVEKSFEPEPKSPSPDGEPADPSVENDPQMISLAERMGKAMVFVATSMTNVQVPRDYSFDFEVTGPEFWRACGNIGPRGTKRKHEVDRKPVRHGFLAEEIIRKGAVDLPGARLPNLTNAIHPLFQRDAFDGCEDDVYEQFLPAVRLASMFLTHPTCAQYWVTLAFGERVIDSTMSTRMGRLQHRIPRDLKISTENARKVSQYLLEIGKNYRVHFTFVHRMRSGDMKWAGVTQKVRDYSCDAEWSADTRREDARSDLLRIHTRLSSDWYVAAKKLSKLKFPDTAQLLRFNFGFATLLTHEICHAIELAHIRTRPETVADSSWNNELQQEIGHEPFFIDNHIPELGYTWENYMFGGKIWPINDRMDCLHGLCVTDWPIRSVDIWDSSKIEFYAIPMTYIEPLFQAKTWEQDLDITNTKLWHISRDGAKSIYLASFTTMDFEEEQRIKSEEKQERLAEQDSKEPAPKKRRTSINDEENAVALSSRGKEDASDSAPELEKPPAPVKTTAPLAERDIKKAKSRDKAANTKMTRSAAKARYRGSSAEHLAKKVGLGSGKRR